MSACGRNWGSRHPGLDPRSVFSLKQKKGRPRHKARETSLGEFMRKFILSVAAAFLASSVAAQAPNPPKLLVVISVDQFSANLFDEYRPQFSAGFARLATGTVFRNGYQSHAATETCPGHSTILTGDHPARTGIIANLWIDQTVQRTDKSVYCAEDERAPGSTSVNYKVSPDHLLVPTLGELMKVRWPGSRNV